MSWEMEERLQSQTDTQTVESECVCECVYPADQSLALALTAGNHANVGWADSEPPGEKNKRVCCLGRQSAVWPPVLKMKEETQTEFTRQLSASPSIPSCTHTLFNRTPVLIMLCVKVLHAFTNSSNSAQFYELFIKIQFSEQLLYFHLKTKHFCAHI